MELVIDIALLAIVGLLTFLVAQDGPWNAILAMFAVIFGGLVAMNFFEPLAALLEGLHPVLRDRADFISLMGLFTLSVFLIRLGLENVAPTNLHLPEVLYKICQWGFGFATAYITMAVLLTALHTAALPRNFLGFRPERPNFLGISAPDIQWLGFTHHVTSHVFARRSLIMNQRGATEVVYRNFDGMRHLFPGKTQSDYLPSFIIRYATRRRGLEGPVVQQTQPRQVIPAQGGPGQVGPGL